MKQKIRYGIIGCGSMGREHIENIRALPQTEVTALADNHATSREAALAQLDGQAKPPAVFDNYQSLLESGLCDAVVIATPNFTHADIMRHALPTDAHLLIEKPLCTTLTDCMDLVNRANGRRSIVWVAQEYRYMPPVAEMIRLAHEGAIGTLHQVAIREHREPFYPKVADWNRFSVNTGGTLVEKCCHYFNLMELILKEEAVRVFASGAQRVNHLDEKYDGPNGQTVPDILDSAYVIVEYPSGARAMLDLCMFAENSTDNEHVVVVGDEGKLESLIPSLVLRHSRREDWGNRKVWGQASGTGKGVSTKRVWDTNIRYPGQHYGASYIEHQHFANAIREGLPAEVTLAEGMRSVAVGLAAHQSIASGLPVLMADVMANGMASAANRS
jgi:myo-inositol 2-dehydrogenase / D-chiro-inositol 1-dehydrogenase